MVAGRSTEGRSIAGVGTTNASAALTAPANSFEEEDAGRTITGTGIPAAATILSVASPTAATLSANATATGTITATLGAAAGTAYGFTGWSPESDAESETYTVTQNGANEPSKLANAVTAVTQRGRG